MTAFVLAAANGEFKPQEEFDLPAWVPIHLGPLDMSINKAVVYLWVGAALTVLLGVWLMRFGLSLRPSRRQTTGEALYEAIEGQIAEGSLPSRAIGTWFPYVASLFLFIWVLNVVGFIPLPISNEHFHVAGLELPTWGIYAATANLSVTVALALLTFVLTHEEGIRHNGFRRYFASWIPAGLPPFNIKTAILWVLIVFLEYVSQLMRLVSLSVRLFANMLAGHMLILVMIGLIFIINTAPWKFLGLPGAFAVYFFELVIVVTIQAFVFALLSAIYIGGAIQPEH
jgi:F-type H+-transporting ATPase subunit a